MKLLFLFWFCSFVLAFSEVIPNNVGVNIHFMEPKAGEMELLAELSATHVRMDFIWDQVETVKGRYDFSRYDAFFHTILSNGITPYMIFDYYNRFYDGGVSPYTDEGRAAFANFAYSAVERYHGKGIIWEIYNEPNGGFWKPKPNVDDYCKLAHTVLNRIKPNFPNEIIVGPTTSGIDLKYLKEVFDRELLFSDTNYTFDYISVHPYGDNPPEKVSSKYYDLRKLMENYSKTKTPKGILSGEWGFNDISTKSVEKQGWFVSRELAINTMNHIPLSIWYDFHDDGANKTWTEDHFGLVYNTYYPGRTPCYDLKPGFYAFKTFTSLLKGYSFLQKHSSKIYIWHYILEYTNNSNNNNNIFLVWSDVDLSENSDGHIDVDIGKGKSVNLFSFDGKSMGSLSADKDGKVKVPEKNGIVYLVPI